MSFNTVSNKKKHVKESFTVTNYTFARSYFYIFTNYKM